MWLSTASNQAVIITTSKQVFLCPKKSLRPDEQLQLESDRKGSLVITKGPDFLQTSCWLAFFKALNLHCTCAQKNTHAAASIMRAFL